MTTVESLKEIFKKTNAGEVGERYAFAPDFDADSLFHALFMLHVKDEPLSALFYFYAKQGFFSNSPRIFLFTNENFYIYKGGEIKYSDIVGVSYREELKKSFLSRKMEGHIVIELANGEKKDFPGAYGTPEVVNFLNEAFAELKKNPPPALPPKDCTHADELVGKIKAYFGTDLSSWSFKPDIKFYSNEMPLVSLIIHCQNKEYTTSCAARFFDKKTEHVLYFFNDTLYIGNNREYREGFKSVKYTDLTSVTYEEEEVRTASGDIKVNKKLLLFSKDNEPILVAENGLLSTEKNADFFSKLISEETGKTVKTNVVRKEAPSLEEMKFQIDVEIEGDDDFSRLMRKWVELFKNRSLLVDPVQEEGFVVFVDNNTRAERANKREKELLRPGDRHLFSPDDVKKCPAKVMDVNQYITDKLIIEIGKSKSDVRFVDRVSSRLQSAPATEYYICYYPDKNNENAYLRFCFDIDDLTVKTKDDDVALFSPVGYLRLEFKSGDIELSCEKEISYDQKYLICDGLNELLKEKGIEKKGLLKDGFRELLEVYIEKPYTLSPAEAEKRAKIEEEKKRKEQEHEKQMQERMRQEQERERQEKLRKEEEARKLEEQRIAAAEAKRKATIDALDNF